MQDKTIFNSKLISYIGMVLLLCLSVSCKKKSDQAQNNQTTPQVVEAAPAPTPEQPKEKPIYVYSGDRFRDPFTPSGQITNYQPDAVFDPQRASVKGIVFGQGFKSAVLSIGGSGTYFIKAGRIFDVMGKPVEGYSAKVFVDKVLVLGEADNVYELKIKNDDDEGGKAL